MRFLGLSLVCLLLSVTIAAQDGKPLRVCVVTAEGPRGNDIAQSSNPNSERDLLLKKLNSNPKLEFKAYDAISGEGMSCSEKHAKIDCRYIVAVTPITASSYKYIAPLPTQSSESYKAPQPDEATKFVQEHQQEALDHANVRYQVFENGNCRLVVAKDLSKLQTVSGPPTRDSIDWLTTKVAEGVSAAIAKDAKKQRP